jgi:pSer/pThr/pTyr-binding forkhead associated (FHA) protein
VITVDPTLQTPDSPPPPTQAAITVALDSFPNPAVLIGRTSSSRAIYPEIALDFDSAISTRHAILTLTGDPLTGDPLTGGTWTLRDIGSSNGTYLNGKEITPMQDVPLKQGDRITLGHWTAMVFTAIVA